VSRYLTNELIGRGLLFRREASCEVPPFNNCHHAVPLRYAVLASLSGRYSPPEGRLPTCYSPVRHSPGAEAPFPFDLHVLGTPPALILSQDQTLSHESWSTKTGSLSLSNRATVQLSAPSRSASEKTEPSVPHSQVSRQGHALSSFQTSIASPDFERRVRCTSWGSADRVSRSLAQRGIFASIRLERPHRSRGILKTTIWF
jgi:hypothetical protein